MADKLHRLQKERARLKERLAQLKAQKTADTWPVEIALKAISKEIAQIKRKKKPNGNP